MEDEEVYAPNQHLIYISFDEESSSLRRAGIRLIQSSGGGDEQGDEARAESCASDFQYKVGHLYPRRIPE